VKCQCLKVIHVLLILTVKKFANWSIFDEVIKRSLHKMFHFLRNPVSCVTGVYRLRDECLDHDHCVFLLRTKDDWSQSPQVCGEQSLSDFLSPLLTDPSHAWLGFRLTSEVEFLTARWSNVDYPPRLPLYSSSVLSGLAIIEEVWHVTLRMQNVTHEVFTVNRRRHPLSSVG